MLLEALLGVLLLLLLYKVINRKPEGLPPGEWGIPVLGAWMPSGVTMEDHAKALKEKYGDIFLWRMGSRTMVFLNKYPLIKAAFAHPSLQDRAGFYTFDAFSGFENIGLFNSNGINWHNSRRFALHQLKDLGMGKSSLVEAIQVEVEHLVEDFRKNTNKVKPIPFSLNVAVLNVIWRLVSDVRFDVDDPKIHEFNKKITNGFNLAQGANLTFDFLPWLPKVAPPFVRKWLNIDAMLKSFAEIKDYVLDVIKEHEAALDYDNPKDYIDIYLVEMAAQKGDPNSTMSKNDLWIQVADFFTAGSETTNQTLRWALMHLADKPEIQRRAQREIDDVVERGRLPSLQDKPKLPYVEAITLEVSRCITVFPLGVAHYATEDVKLFGYNIPKNTVLIPNLEMCHKDPDYWEKPEEFYPDHFLDKDGKCMSRPDGYLPFSTGRRICIGESLARLELYLFLSGLLQNFNFSVPEGEKLNLARDPNNVLFNFPKDLNIMITSRE